MLIFLQNFTAVSVNQTQNQRQTQTKKLKQLSYRNSKDCPLICKASKLYTLKYISQMLRFTVTVTRQKKTINGNFFCSRCTTP